MMSILKEVMIDFSILKFAPILAKCLIFIRSTSFIFNQAKSVFAQLKC